MADLNVNFQQSRAINTPEMVAKRLKLTQEYDIKQTEWNGFHIGGALGTGAGLIVGLGLGSVVTGGIGAVIGKKIGHRRGETEAKREESALMRNPNYCTNIEADAGACHKYDNYEMKKLDVKN